MSRSQRYRWEACRFSQPLYALRPAGGALVNAGRAIGHRLGIARTIGVATARALRLRQQRQDGGSSSHQALRAAFLDAGFVATAGICADG